MAAKKGKGPRPSVMGSSWSSGRPAGWQDDLLGGIRNIVDTATGRQRNPAEPQVVTRGRAATSAIVQTGAAGLDAYVTGGLAGSFYRNVAQPQAVIGSPDRRSREQREGLGRFGRDVAVTAATAGAAYGAARVVPKIVQRVAPQLRTEIGVHSASPFAERPITGRIEYSPGRRDTGWGEGLGVPVVSDRTYKWSGRVYEAGKPGNVGRELSPQALAQSSFNYGDSPYRYVTRSRVGLPDPEYAAAVETGRRSNSRITGNQRIMETVASPQPVEYGGFVGEGYDRSRYIADTAAAVARQRAILNAERAALPTRVGFAAGRAAAGAQAIGRPNRRGRNVR